MFYPETDDYGLSGILITNLHLILKTTHILGEETEAETDVVIGQAGTGPVPRGDLQNCSPWAPLRAVQCVCGDICCLRGGPGRGVGVGKAAEQAEEPPLGVPQDTLQRVPGTGKPGEGPLLSGLGGRVPETIRAG